MNLKKLLQKRADYSNKTVSLIRAKPTGTWGLWCKSWRTINCSHLICPTKTRFLHLKSGLSPPPSFRFSVVRGTAPYLSTMGSERPGSHEVGAAELWVQLPRPASLHGNFSTIRYQLQSLFYELVHQQQDTVNISRRLSRMTLDPIIFSVWAYLS